MTKVNKLQQRSRKMFERMLRGKRPGGRILTTIQPLDKMLAGPRFAEGTVQLWRVCCASAFGMAERQDCFCCLQPWSPDRVLETIGVAEFVERPDATPTHVLMFGICLECSWDKSMVLAAMKRGDFTEITSPPGTA
jgi:hypothetical protein